jgi:hypothetical protein
MEKPKFKVNEDDENGQESDGASGYTFEEKNEDFYTALLLDNFSMDTTKSYEDIEEEYRIKPGHLYFIEAVTNLVTA